MRTLLFLLLLLLASLCALAQESPSRDGTANRKPETSASRPADYQGCIIRASGNIRLADPSGKEYKLLSRAGLKLESYVGQEVQITAEDVNPDDQSSGERSINSGQPSNGVLALNVDRIEKVSDHCSSPK
jgi:hypothetical protein